MANFKMNTQFGGIDFDLLKYDIDLYSFKTNRFFEYPLSTGNCQNKK